jgi:nucleoside-diphosphate-sugar epimerase
VSDGRHVLLTGATGGIGLAAAIELARRDHRLAIVARSQTKADEAVRRIGAAAGDAGRVDVLIADLASQASVRALAAEALARYPRIDVLVNNAGAVYSIRQLTEDGIELTWAVNHLAPFLLTTLLLDRLVESAPGRVVTTASRAHVGARIPFDDLAGERSFGPRGIAWYSRQVARRAPNVRRYARRSVREADPAPPRPGPAQFVGHVIEGPAAGLAFSRNTEHEHYVAERLGDTVGMVHEMYGHVTPRMRVAAVRRLASTFQ